MNDSPIELTDALKQLSTKRVLALSPSIGTAEMEKLAPQIRQAAFYSARTPYAEYLADFQRGLQNLVQPDAAIGPDGLIARKAGESISPAQLRAWAKRQLDALGYNPGKELAGGLQDLSSDRRINLIISTQDGMARGYGGWKQAQNPTVLDLWPADELYRALARKEHRDWDITWNAARADLGDSTSATEADNKETGPFVALKNDPIWSAISTFDLPYPPFDYDSGMRVRDVARARAIALGVLDHDETVDPQDEPFCDGPPPFPLDIPGPLLDALKSIFADWKGILA